MFVCEECFSEIWLSVVKHNERVCEIALHECTLLLVRTYTEPVYKYCTAKYRYRYELIRLPPNTVHL